MWTPEIYGKWGEKCVEEKLLFLSSPSVMPLIDEVVPAANWAKSWLCIINIYNPDSVSNYKNDFKERGKNRGLKAGQL